MVLTAAERWNGVMIPNYGTPKVTLVRGSGSTVFSDTGVEYVDFLGGIAVNSLGHAHPAIVEAVTRQVAQLGHTSNLAVTLPALELAEHLVTVLRGEGPHARTDEARVFFCNSGAEANEAAFKLTRMTGRTKVVAATGAFHGRTMGALALTGQPAKTDPFRPLPGDVEFVTYGDVVALEAAVDAQTAAVILEPIQGEAGVVVPPAGYLASAQSVAHRSGALLVLDEVQTGVGRTGEWFGHQGLAEGPIQPDVVTMAKGLGGGLPIGAMVAFGRAAQLLGPGSHGSTFGGNPIAAAAALAVLEVIERDGLLGRATEIGHRIAAGFALPGVVRVRGRGLLLGIVLDRPVAADVEAAAREEGVLVNAAAPDVIRLAPALTISDDEVGSGIKRLAGAIEAVLR